MSVLPGSFDRNVNSEKQMIGERVFNSLIKSPASLLLAAIGAKLMGSYVGIHVYKKRSSMSHVPRNDPVGYYTVLQSVKCIRVVGLFWLLLTQFDYFR